MVLQSVNGRRWLFPVRQDVINKKKQVPFLRSAICESKELEKILIWIKLCIIIPLISQVGPCGGSYCRLETQQTGTWPRVCEGHGCQPCPASGQMFGAVCQSLERKNRWHLGDLSHLPPSSFNKHGPRQLCMLPTQTVYSRCQWESHNWNDVSLITFFLDAARCSEMTWNTYLRFGGGRQGVAVGHKLTCPWSFPSPVETGFSWDQWGS